MNLGMNLVMTRALDWKTCVSFTVAASMLMMTACRGGSEQQRGAGVKAVIGASELHAEQDANLAQVIGRLSFTEGSCTAFVTGAREITTAAHCVDGTSAADLGALQFKTAAGVAASVNEVVRIDPVHDVAVLRVDTNFNHQMPSQMSGTDSQRDTVKVVGFSGDREELLASATCAWEPSEEAGAMITHLCDTEPGMSGAPLVSADGRVVGVHVGYLRSTQQNVAALATGFTEQAPQPSRVDQDTSTTKVDQEWGPRVRLPEVKVEWPRELQPVKVEPRHLACIYALNAGVTDSGLCGACLTATGAATAGAAAAACSVPCGMAVADLAAVIISCQ